MYTIVEITLYPLTRDYEGPILDFIDRMQAYSDLDISTGETSTLIRGPFDIVMHAIKNEMRVSLAGSTRMSFVLKVLNAE